MRLDFGITLTGPSLLVVALALPSCSADRSTKGDVDKSAPAETTVLQTPPKATPEFQPPPAAFAGYRKWYRANPAPLPMKESMMRLCLSLSPEEVKAIQDKDPHDAVQVPMTFTVFVNEAGKDRLLSRTTGAFPIGSCIVKDAHDGSDFATSRTLTAMIKREKGYSPETGDWEYFVLDGFAKSVTRQGKLENCASCHASVADNDYVYTDYLPKDE